MSFTEAEVTKWLLEHDGGKGICYVCRKAFVLGERVMYETPDQPRKYMHKISRHKDCVAPPRTPE